MAETHPTTHPAARERRPWEPPRVVPLPRLTELTLATGVTGVEEGPGFGGGSVVIP